MEKNRDSCPYFLKSPIMTQRYAHHYPESLRDGVETLDRISTISAQCEEKGVTATALP